MQGKNSYCTQKLHSKENFRGSLKNYTAFPKVHCLQHKIHYYELICVPNLEDPDRLYIIYTHKAQIKYFIYSQHFLNHMHYTIRCYINIELIRQHHSLELLYREQNLSAKHEGSYPMQSLPADLAFLAILCNAFEYSFSASALYYYDR